MLKQTRTLLYLGRASPLADAQKPVPTPMMQKCSRGGSISCEACHRRVVSPANDSCDVGFVLARPCMT